MTKDYDQHSSIQLESNRRNLGPLVEALIAVKRPNQTINLADFGSATGMNSMKTFKDAISAFRANDSTEIHVFHVDLPSNAWSVLFNNLNTSANSYLHLPHTSMSSIGRSHFSRLFPSSFLSLGCATYSLHWLSRHSTLDNQLPLYHNQDPECINALKSIAMEDLRMFLTHREQELTPGGRLIIQTPIGKLDLDSFYEVLKDMENSGKIGPELLHSFSLPWYLRSSEDYNEVLTAFPQFRIVSKTIINKNDPFYEKLQSDGDLDTYGKNMINASRTATEKLFLDAFDRFYSEKKTELIEEFYLKLTEYVKLHAQPVLTTHMTLVLEKIGIRD